MSSLPTLCQLIRALKTHEVIDNVWIQESDELADGAFHRKRLDPWAYRCISKAIWAYSSIDEVSHYLFGTVANIQEQEEKKKKGKERLG